MNFNCNLLEDNKAFTTGRIYPEALDDLQTLSWFVDADTFQGGKILDIGGGYLNNFAIVRQ